MSVEPGEADEEETFCAVVPEKHAFTLAGGIIVELRRMRAGVPGRGDLPEDALPEKWEPFVKINYATPTQGRSTGSQTSTRSSTTSRTSRSHSSGEAWSSSGSTT